MPEPLLPTFPTQFTPEDEERLKQLEEQRKALSQAWGVKFSEKAWARTPGIEKFARKAAPSFLTPTIGILPGTAETMEFGFTPEQFRQSMRDTEEEFKDISRRRKVTELLPNIQSDIMLSAISGDPIKDVSELMSTFPELRKDFNEQEINYLARMSQALIGATPEQVMSGELFSYEPNQLPVSQEDLDGLFKTSKDPRYIFATVEFAKNLEDVTAALRQEYPSQVPEDEATKAMRDKFREYFRQRNEELGITPVGIQPTKQVIQGIHTKVAEEEGELLTLTDDKGGVTSAKRKSDGTVWMGDEILGYAKEDGSIVGFNLQGQPLITPEMEESAIKDLWDAWFLTSNRSGMSVEKAFTQIIPDFFLSTAEKAEKLSPVGLLDSKRAKEARLITINSWRGKLKARYEQSTLEFNEWLTKHPELNPRPEWSKPVESPRDFFNPGRIAYVIASNAPIMAAAMLTGIGTTLATGGNVLIGSLAATTVMTPTMIGDVVDDAVENGASFEDATTLSSVVGLGMGAIEILPFGIALKILQPAFMTAFKGNLQKELTSSLIKNLTAKGILGRVAKNTLAILASEEAEEVIQQVMQNSVIKTFNENRSLLEGIGQTALDTFWAVTPLALTGGASTYYGMKRNLPPKVQQQIDEVSAKFQEAGLEPDHAEAVALSQVVETEVGQAQVEEAMEASSLKPEDFDSLVNKINSLHNKAKEQVGSPSAIIGEDLAEYNNTLTRLDSLKKAKGYNLINEAETGVYFRTYAVRAGKPGIFYSDLPAKEFGKEVRWGVITFNNPLVFESQLKASKKIFDQKTSDEIGDEWKKVSKEAGGIFATLQDRVNTPSVVTFFRELDDKIAQYARSKGYDGIIYTHGSKSMSGEYVVFGGEGEISPVTPEVTSAITSITHYYGKPIKEALKGKSKEDIDTLTKQLLKPRLHEGYTIRLEDIKEVRGLPKNTVQELLETEGIDASDIWTHGVNPYTRNVMGYEVYEQWEMVGKVLPPAPVTPEVTESGVLPQTTFLENKLSSYNEEMSREISTIEAHKKRLEGMSLSSEERLDEEDSIKRAQDRLDIITRDKKALIKKIRKAKEVPETPKPPEPTIEELEFQELKSRNPDAKIKKVDNLPHKYEVIKNNQRLFLVNLEQARELIETNEITSSPESVKVEDIVSSEPGEKIAEELGVIYDGIQEGIGDIPSSMQFTDPQTGSTTYGNTLEEVRTRIEAMRNSFIQAIMDKIRKEQRLNIEESRLYFANEEMIEARMKEETKNFLQQVSEEAAKAIVTLKRLVPDLTFDPSQSMPKLPDLDKELIRTQEAIDLDPRIKKLLKPNKGVEARAKEALDKLNNLHTEIEVATGELYQLKGKRKVKEEKRNLRDYISEREKQLKELGKKTGLSPKTLLTKGWGDLTPIERARVAIALVPDHSIDSGIVDDFRDTVLVMSSMEGHTGLPFLHNVERIEIIRGYAIRLQDEYFKRIVNVPRWRKIVRNRNKMAQVALIVDSKRPDSDMKVNPPETEEEHLMVEVADAIEAIYREWQPIVRFQRFIEAYEAGSNPISIQGKIKDAPIEDIQEAVSIFEESGEDALWDFLGTKSWGVIKSGYSPWRISKPNLALDEAPWTTVRGASYLMSRDSTQMPWEAHKDFLRTFDSYNLSMALRFFLKKEVQSLADNMDASWDKWSNPEHVQDYLRKYLRAVQGYPEEDSSIFLRIMRKMQSWASPNIFWHPWVGTRNILQFFYSHPYREELVRALWEYKNLPEDLKIQASERFATVVDQSGRPLRSWMFQDEEISILGEVPSWVKTALIPIKIATKPFDFLAAQTAKIPTIAFTDKASRAATYKSMLTKAWRATEQYKQDHNAKKWFDNSGINSGYISNEQQQHILGLLALGDSQVSWAIPGLQEVSGYNAAIIRVAEETTNRTLYLYDRALAAGAHRGGGRTFSSLLTFPRSTIQMYGQQFARVVGKESTIGERLAATKNILLLWLTGELLGSFLIAISGRRRKEYSILNNITWSFGGLGVGIASDVFDYLSDIATAVVGTSEDKDRVLSRLPQELSRLGDVLVGFYKIMMDSIEALSDEERGLDIRWYRQVRALIDKDYTPEQQEKAERTVLEMVQKILMGADPPDPDFFEKAQESLMKDEARLGTMDLEGKFFTLGNYGRRVEALTKVIPDYLLIEESGFSDLTLFYLHSRDKWLELYTLSSEKRNQWRKQHILEEAMLLFWEKYDKSVFTRGSKESREIKAMLKTWFEIYGIDRTKHSKWTRWSLPVEIPLPEEK